MNRRTVAPLPTDAFEAYARGEITLTEATNILRRSRGRVPWAAFAREPAYAFGWLIRRAACFVGLHMWDWDDGEYVPYYGHGAWVCFVCALRKVKP